MPDKNNEGDEDDEDDSVEKFGTSNLLAEWREKLKEYSAEYTSWMKKAKSLQLKALNMKHSLSKDMLKVSQPIAAEARQLQHDLFRIPCSSRESDDFTAFLEALLWLTDLMEVRTLHHVMSVS